MREDPYKELQRLCRMLTRKPRWDALLVLAKRRELPVEDLAAEVGLAFSLFKPHLKVLTTAGMVAVKGGMCRLGRRVVPDKIDGRPGVTITNPDGTSMGYTGPGGQ